jgi:hypothetical protein
MAVKLSLSLKQNSQSVANNSSNVTLTATASWTYGSWNEYQKPGYVILDGTRYDFKSNFNPNATTSGSKVLFTKTVDIPHNADGSKTVAYSGSYTTGVSSGTITASGSATLTKIPRQANLTDAPNFNDEQNPTITYSNPAGNAVDKLEACIASSDGATIYVPYRDISKTGTSYTFNLTAAERNALRNATPNSNTMTVKFYVQTTIAGVVYRSNIAKILTIINNKPTLNPVVKDAGTGSTALTGDVNKIIKGYNYVSVNSGGAAVKGATIKSQKITCGGVVINSGSGSFTNVETATFEFTITDSRGNTTTQKVNKTLIPYVQLSCNFNAHCTIAGEININLSGNYYSETFGKVVNDLTVEYRYKEQGGTYSAWASAGILASDNKYTGNATITGLDYRKIYVVQARVADKIFSITTAEKKVKAVPVFDWGENDFKFNVPAYDEKGVKLGSEITAENQAAVAVSGRILQETGFVSITPVANTPTSAAVKFKKTYKKIPTIVMSVASGVPGTQVLGYGQTGISTTGVNVVVTRTNTTPTILYYYVFGEVAD